MTEPKVPAERARPLSGREKEAMLAVLVRNKQAFETFREVITAESFGALDVHLALVWQLTCDYHSKYEKLPGRGILVALAETQIEDNPELITDTEELSALIDVIFDDKEWGTDLSTSDTDRQWATDVAKRFLQERLAAEVQQSIRGEGRFEASLPEFFSAKLALAEYIEGLETNNVSLDLFEDGWDSNGGIAIHTTHLEFLDHFMSGGDAPGEVYGLMGPFGSCKTTVAIMRAVEGARAAEARQSEEQGQGRWGYSFFFSYEAPKTELRIRIMSYAARIDRGRLERMDQTGVKSLSTSKKLEKYEKKLFYKQLKASKFVPGERGRTKLVKPWLNRHLIAVDMTGTDKTRPGAGGGYVDEVRRMVTWELRRRKNLLASQGIFVEPYAACIVIDYVGLMCWNYLQAQGHKDDRMLRHLVGKAPSVFRNKVALHFKCPVYLIHQLSGAANDKSSGARLSHTDAAEAKNFGENLDFCFIVGPPNGELLFQFINSKHRRSGAHDPLIMRLRGELSRIESTGEMYRVDTKRCLIVEKTLQAAGVAIHASAAGGATYDSAEQVGEAATLVSAPKKSKNTDGIVTKKKSKGAKHE